MSLVSSHLGLPVGTSAPAPPVAKDHLNSPECYPLDTLGNRLRFIKDQIFSKVGLGICAVSAVLGFASLPLAASFITYIGRKTAQICQEDSIHNCSCHPAKRKWERTLTIATNFAAMTLSAGLGAWGSYAFNDSALGLLANARLAAAPLKAMGLLSSE